MGILRDAKVSMGVGVATRAGLHPRARRRPRSVGGLREEVSSVTVSVTKDAGVRLAYHHASPEALRLHVWSKDNKWVDALASLGSRRRPSSPTCRRCKKCPRTGMKPEQKGVREAMPHTERNPGLRAKPIRMEASTRFHVKSADKKSLSSRRSAIPFSLSWRPHLPLRKS